jgi:hypothetical protein
MYGTARYAPGQRVGQQESAFTTVMLNRLNVNGLAATSTSTTSEPSSARRYAEKGAAADLTLSDEEVAELEALYRPHAPYGHS